MSKQVTVFLRLVVLVLALALIATACAPAPTPVPTAAPPTAAPAVAPTTAAAAPTAAPTAVPATPTAAKPVDIEIWAIPTSSQAPAPPDTWIGYKTIREKLNINLKYVAIAQGADGERLDE